MAAMTNISGFRSKVGDAMGNVPNCCRRSNEKYGGGFVVEDIKPTGFTGVER
jgi:hypothetical protein